MHFSTPRFLSPSASGRLPAIAPVCLASILFAFGAAWSKPPARSAGSNKTKSAPAAAAPAATAAASATPKLDSARVHRLYLDGEFDAAIAILEDNLKETRQYRHEDSVFIFKHLGVMYAAQYETREKGKYYMHKLLSVEPTVRIMDMYASDMIYMIFKNIQEEFEQNRSLLSEVRQNNSRAQSGSRADSMPGHAARTEPEDKRHRPEQAGEAQPGNGKTWLWTGAAVAAVAAGIGAYYLISADPQQTVKEKEVNF